MSRRDSQNEKPATSCGPSGFFSASSACTDQGESPASSLGLDPHAARVRASSESCDQITPEMIEAGAQVLRSSGLIEYPRVCAERSLVEDVFTAMAAARAAACANNS